MSQTVKFYVFFKITFLPLSSSIMILDKSTFSRISLIVNPCQAPTLAPGVSTAPTGIVIWGPKLLIAKRVTQEASWEFRQDEEKCLVWRNPHLSQLYNLWSVSPSPGRSQKSWTLVSKFTLILKNSFRVRFSLFHCLSSIERVWTVKSQNVSKKSHKLKILLFWDW